jgi:hypothetical protein
MAAESNVQYFSKEKIKELQQNPSNVVYGYEDFEPLELDQVKEYCRQAYLHKCKFQRDHKPYTEEACEKKLRTERAGDEGFLYFMKYYPSFLTLLLNKASGIKELKRATDLIEQHKKQKQG